MLHALEAVDLLERDGLILVAAGLLEQELVGGKVGVGEVEFDLAPDFVGVAALGQVLVVRLDVVALLLARAIITVVAALVAAAVVVARLAIVVVIAPLLFVVCTDISANSS